VRDAYLSRHHRFGLWRDIHVRVKGPVAKAIQFCFVEDWHWATSRFPSPKWGLTPFPGESEEVLMVASGPADSLETCALIFVQVFNMAEDRIWIPSPYFVSDLKVLRALKLAALRETSICKFCPLKNPIIVTSTWRPFRITRTSLRRVSTFTAIWPAFSIKNS
jgi:cardiolipin synthase